MSIMKRIPVKDMAANVLQLPRLPIPPLELTAERYRASIVALKPPETVKAHFHKLDMFLASSGKHLQKALVEADDLARAKGGYPHSYFEPISDDAYLSNRAPLLVHTNPAFLINKLKKAGNGQAGVTAAIVHGIAKWVYKAVKDGVEVHNANQDISPLLRQFGASLIPGEKTDRFCTTPLESLRHIIVLHDGHPYAVRVFGEQQIPLERAVVQKSIEYILSITPDADNTTPVSVLTACSRQTWAGAYAELVRTPENAEALKKIQEGMIVVCLDTEKWTDDNKLKNGAMLHGNQTESENRWYDKHQIIISADGQVAFNFEHSGSDGVQWVRWISDVIKEVESAEADSASVADTAAAAIDASKVTSLVQPLRVTFGKNFAGHIRSARKEMLELINETALEDLTLPFGKKLLKQVGVSPDAFVQMCFHVAFHKCRNKLAPTYESCSTSRFFHGRTEAIRSATLEMLHLAEAVNKVTRNTNATAEVMREAEAEGAAVHTKVMEVRDSDLSALAKAASERHVVLAKAAAMGEGVDRHLTALRRLAVEQQDAAALNFFNDEVYKSCTNWILSTSNVSAPWMDRFTFGPVTRNGYGLGYAIDEDEIRIMVSVFTSSPSTNVSDMKAAIAEGASILYPTLIGTKA